jgi:8-oxo-dGTP pyrophosphatase MutT (NUDIX family)
LKDRPFSLVAVRRRLLEVQGPLPEANRRRSAVLAPLFLRDGELSLLFILRRDLPRFGRQVAFPGGGVETYDEDDRATAIREVEEELGIPAVSLEVLGKLGHFPTRTSDYDVAAHLAFWRTPAPCRPCPEEVDRVFSVPVRELMIQDRQRTAEERGLDPVYRVEGLALPCPVLGGEDPSVANLPRVWGVTARILRHLLGEILGEEAGPRGPVRPEAR